ncbi:hypothetical protein PIB30_072081, partial [Stylosanthes scabra]|nr:hypothetical protein [Stylosanthes scabra]
MSSLYDPNLPTTTTTILNPLQLGPPLQHGEPSYSNQSQAKIRFIHPLLSASSKLLQHPLSSNCNPPLLSGCRHGLPVCARERRRCPLALLSAFIQILSSATTASPTAADALEAACAGAKVAKSAVVDLHRNPIRHCSCLLLYTSCGSL